LTVATAMAKSALQEYAVEGWLHLDHGSSIEIVQRCLDAGFDSVMIDASEKPLDENIRITNQVVEMASDYGVNVEAELGFVAKLGQEQNNMGFTQPGDAIRFADNTGVHALAIAIGSAHGFYKQAPSSILNCLHKLAKVSLSHLYCTAVQVYPKSCCWKQYIMAYVKLILRLKQRIPLCLPCRKD